MITVTIVARYRLGAYSIFSAQASGSMPPRGIPSISRSQNSVP
jgi:hypothetical protein